MAKFGRKHIQMVDNKGKDVPRRNYRYARPALKALLDAVLMDKSPRTLYDNDTGTTLVSAQFIQNTRKVVVEIESPRRVSNLMLDTPRRGRK